MEKSSSSPLVVRRNFPSPVAARDVVVADADAYLRGQPTQEWFVELGLPSNLLDGRDPNGVWISLDHSERPIMRSRNGTTAPV